MSGYPADKYKGSNHWKFKHGDHKSSEYYSWSGAKGRCRNPKNKNYDRYGGRGIKFCERWNDYKVFLTDMGRKPSPKHSLERVDNDGDYCPENCKWATSLEQCHNRRVYIVLANEFDALKKKLLAYERLYGDISI